VEAADVREGGQWTLAQRAKNDVLWLLASGALALTERLPSRVLRAMGEGVGLATWLLLPKVRRLALANVAQAMPALDAPARRALVLRAYRSLGRELGAVVGMLDPRRSLPVLPFLPGARECFDEALAARRGVVFASAHLGPWERVAASLVDAGLPLTVVAREAYDPRLTRLYDRLRGDRGIRTVYRGATGAGAGLLRALRRGDVLGVPMDLASRVPSIDVPFLGVSAPTPVGPARLALRARAPVIVGTAAPLPDASGLGIAAARIETSDLDATSAGERELTRRINAALSERILALPDAWVWMHPRWPHSRQIAVG
jgi:Kdo2-lipid IVA lauroyltransferase/acyltransferase